MTSTSTEAEQTTAENLEERFDEGKEVLDYFDVENGEVEYPDPNDIKRVNVDFPLWMVEGLDKAAEHLAINRQAVIKTWIADRLKEEHLA